MSIVEPRAVALCRHLNGTVPLAATILGGLTVARHRREGRTDTASIATLEGFK